MELPHLGEHCSFAACNKLDFLPISCELCKNTFCHDHHKYDAHQCSERYTVDVQVPICPLCDNPVPFKRGEPPDIAVNDHITNNCKVKKKKIYTNKCMSQGCKAKELVSISCDSCQMNFCLRHRNPIDHECKGSAAARRDLTLNGSIFKNFSKEQKHKSKPKDSSTSQPKPPQRRNDITSLQGNLSDEEALERALRESRLDDGEKGPTPIEQDDSEDLALAQAIAASMHDDNTRRRPRNFDSCSLS